MLPRFLLCTLRPFCVLWKVLSVALSLIHAIQINLLCLNYCPLYLISILTLNLIYKYCLCISYKQQQKTHKASIHMLKMSKIIIHFSCNYL